MPKRDHRGRTGAHSARPAKSSGIEGQFIAHRIEMLESTAWASLETLAARRVLDRLEIEHAHHGGKRRTGSCPAHTTTLSVSAFVERRWLPRFDRLRLQDCSKSRIRGAAEMASFATPPAIV